MEGSYTRNCSPGCLWGEQPQVADGRTLFVLVFGVSSLAMSMCSWHRSCLSSIHPPLHPCEQTPDVSGLVPPSPPRETWERPGVSGDAVCIANLKVSCDPVSLGSCRRAGLTMRRHRTMPVLLRVTPALRLRGESFFREKSLVSLLELVTMAAMEPLSALFVTGDNTFIIL